MQNSTMTKVTSLPMVKVSDATFSGKESLRVKIAQAERPMDIWKRYVAQSALNLREPPSLEEAQAYFEKRQAELELPLVRLRCAWWRVLDAVGLGGW